MALLFILRKTLELRGQDEEWDFVHLRCLIITQTKTLCVQVDHDKGTQWKAVGYTLDLGVIKELMAFKAIGLDENT